MPPRGPQPRRDLAIRSHQIEARQQA